MKIFNKKRLSIRAEKEITPLDSDDKKEVSPSVRRCDRTRLQTWGKTKVHEVSRIGV